MRITQFLYFFALTIGLSGCAGCAKSSDPNAPPPDEPVSVEEKSGQTPPSDPAEPPVSEGPATTIQMVKEGGVYKIPAIVNDVPMTFVFDTGASDISISSVEADFLYKQGTLKAEDVQGMQRYRDAEGEISAGMVVRLRTVQLGGRTLRNVQATVVNSSAAPLLMGQSALSQFGKISIDYQTNSLTFE
ncbi:MAG: retroviral-like aspartic protease family protein [Cytophagaceae bacterium]|nr:retroviral-like aspartic protease family protein [Cytophagaceae bacterium]